MHTCPVLSTHLVEWVSLMLNGVRQLLLQHRTQCLSRVLLLLQLENLDFKLRNSLLHSELNPRNICLAPIRCLGRALLLVLVFEVLSLYVRELSTRRSKKCRSRGSILIAPVLFCPSVHVSSRHTSTKLTTVTDAHMDCTKWCDQRDMANALSAKHIRRSETVLVPFLCSACRSQGIRPPHSKAIGQAARSHDRLTLQHPSRCSPRARTHETWSWHCPPREHRHLPPCASPASLGAAGVCALR